MSLFCDAADLNLYGRNLAQLLLMGGFQLETLAKAHYKVNFAEWAKAVSADVSSDNYNLTLTTIT